MGVWKTGEGRELWVVENKGKNKKFFIFCERGIV